MLVISQVCFWVSIVLSTVWSGYLLGEFLAAYMNREWPFHKRG